MVGSARVYGSRVARVGMSVALMAMLVLASAGVAPATIGPAGLETTAMKRASVDAAGDEAANYSELAWLSADGRYASFYSWAALVPEDTNMTQDVYRKDLQTGAIQLASVSSDESQGAAVAWPWGISNDGRYVLFYTSSSLDAGDDNLFDDVYVRDVQTGTTILASVNTTNAVGNGPSTYAGISGDGRYVAFVSSADNFVAGDTPWTNDAFVRDLQTGVTECVSVDASGVPIPGALVAFTSISDDGRYVAFSASTDMVGDGDGAGVFVRDRQTDTTARVTVTYDGNPLSATAYYPFISGDGSCVVYHTDATNLVEGDDNEQRDVYLTDWQAGTNEVISVSSAGELSNGQSRWGSISDDGRYVSFYSYGSNLVGDDTNGLADVFVRDRALGRTARASMTADGEQATGQSTGGSGVAGHSETPNISGDGTRVTFESGATNLVAGDTNGYYDIFVADVDWVLDSVPLAGPSRFDTCVEISKSAFEDSSTVDAVIITTGYNWPDALGGSALAGVLDAPILLVKPSTIPTVIEDEIKRLDPSRAIVLGGTQAVSSAVYEALAGDLGLDVERIDGSNRYDTGRNIAARVVSEQGPDYDGIAFVATGRNFPDALGASPLAAAMGWPIYTVAGSLDDATLGHMKSQGVTQVYILGGTGAVAQGVEDDLSEEFGAGNVERRAGSTRYSTCVDVAELGVAECGLRWDRVALATGASFPDALAGGVLQARSKSVLLLTPPKTINANTKQALVDNASIIQELRFLGGTSAISQYVRDQATAAAD